MKRVKLALASFVVLVAFAATCAYALTPEQVIQLKKAGVSEETIRVMIQQEKEGRTPYDKMGVTETQDAVIYSTGAPTVSPQGDTEQEKADKAWKMLQNSVIDTRRR